MQDDRGASEAEAAVGMTQLAASGRTHGSAQSTGGNHVGALQNLGNTLIALAREVPLEVSYTKSGMHPDDVRLSHPVTD